MRSHLAPLPGPPRGRLADPGWLGSLTVYDGIARVAVALVPLALAVAWALARRRQHAGAAPARAWREALAEVGLVCLMLPAVWITLLPGPEAGQASPRASLVPLRDLATMSTFQVVGNLVLLAGVGLLLPVRFAALASLPRVAAFAATCSATIEAAQYLLPLDRVASVDDVLLNTLGAAAAALASRPWWRRRASGRSRVATRVPARDRTRLDAPHSVARGRP